VKTVEVFVARSGMVAAFTALFIYAIALGHNATEADVRAAYAHGVCDQARDSHLLQPGRYADCVLALTKNPNDQWPTLRSRRLPEHDRPVDPRWIHPR